MDGGGDRPARGAALGAALGSSEGSLPGEAAPRRESVFFSDELGREIVARVAAGETLSAPSRTPGMPSGPSIRVWRYAHPEFGAALTAAQRRARLARRRLDVARAHALAAERMIRPRRYSAAREAETETGGGYGPEVRAQICFGLANGESLISILRDPGMPAPATVYKWLRQEPDFADDYAQARQFHADYLFDEAREVALSADRDNVWARRLHFDVIRWQAARGAPTKYCERLVAQNMVEEMEEKTRPFVVITRRFTDPQDETPEAAQAIRRGIVVSSDSPAYPVGMVMPEGWSG